jgi:predicted dehydrogenase
MAHEVSRRHFLQRTGESALAAGVAAIPLAPPDKQPEHLPIPAPPQKKLGWAVVGLGELALGEIMPAFAQTERCRPTALVSGHPDKARKVADHYGINPKNIYGYDNYDTLKDNPEVDVVYVVLPNSMHAEYTVRALRAGKHVLCEKPMAINPAECRQMIDAAKEANRKLMIAYRLHYEPYNKAVIDMSRKQAYGPIRLISADNVQNVQAPNIRLSHSLGGGPLGDVGVYNINACRYITGQDPVHVTASHFRPTDDPRFAEVPDRVAFTLQFPSGVLATCTAGFSAGASRRYRVFCKDGWYGLDPAYDYRGLRLHIGQGNERREIQLGQVNHFAREMDHMAQCVEQNKTPWTPGEEGLRDTLVMAAIVRAAETGGSVKIADVQPDWPILPPV